jgi:hypothetical protein
MTDITINSKTHKNIESFSIDRLEYTLGLATGALDHYKGVLKTYTKEQMDKYGNPHLGKLENNKRLIEEQILKKPRVVCKQ